MKPTVTVLASGLKFLLFQGVTTFQGILVVATVEAELVRVAPDGTFTTWVNVERYGVPTGIVGLKNSLMVLASARESGHCLIQVSKEGKVSPVCDLSILGGEFGAPFAVAAHEGYYPYYMVAISTDVISSAGVIARVTPSGKSTILTTLTNTPFGVGIGEDYVIVTQENGQVLWVTFTGKTLMATDFKEAQLGIPLGITRFKDDWVITTTTGWLVAIKSDSTLFPVINLAEMGKGLPTTLTAIDHQLIVATQTGNLLQVNL